jgi:hypothetical protein
MRITGLAKSFHVCPMPRSLPPDSRLVPASRTVRSLTSFVFALCVHTEIHAGIRVIECVVCMHTAAAYVRVCVEGMHACVSVCALARATGCLYVRAHVCVCARASVCVHVRACACACVGACVGACMGIVLASCESSPASRASSSPFSAAYKSHDAVHAAHSNHCV